MRLSTTWLRTVRPTARILQRPAADPDSCVAVSAFSTAIERKKVPVKVEPGREVRLLDRAAFRNNQCSRGTDRRTLGR
jgi:hypothetical protein